MSTEPEYRFEDLPPSSAVERAPQIAFKIPGELVAFAPPEGIQLTPGPFPIDAFPSVLREIVKELALVYQTPVCLPAMSALGVMSGAVGKSVLVREAYRDKQTRLNLYLIAVAERGSGKGNIGELLCKPIFRRSESLLECHRQTVAKQKGELGVLRIEVQGLERLAAKAMGDKRAELLERLAVRQHRLAELASEDARVTLGGHLLGALGREVVEGRTLCFLHDLIMVLLHVTLGFFDRHGVITVAHGFFSCSLVSSSAAHSSISACS